jgi:hypothetical protein
MYSALPYAIAQVILWQEQVIWFFF